MKPERCEATTKDGNPCSAQARPGRPWCQWHDPDLAERRREWTRKGGEGRSIANRARKAIPRELRDVQDALLRALADVEGGELDAKQANAMSNLARAIVAVQQAGDVEQRIGALEAAVALVQTDGRTA